MKWHIGCSGFSYKEWKGVFYPPNLPSREWFSFYTSHFNTLELNFTFYRFTRLQLLETWYNKSPVHFTFAVKAPRLITHYKQLNGCEGLLNDFYSVCHDGLKEKLGPLLFQFPSRFTFTEPRLERVISGLDPAFVNVVEFRDPGWWNNKIYSRFRKHKLVFCGMSYPGLPAEAVSTHPTVYYRFHGIEQLYYSSYDEATLRETADSILNKRNVKEVYCYFNNTAAVGAIANAQWMEGYTTGIKQLHASK